MVAGVGAAATILEGGEVDLGGDADEDLPAWMIFTIVFGFVIFPLGMVLANYYFSRRCPKCRKLTLKQQSQQVLSVTRNYRLVEYTYVCPNCGAVVKRRSRNLRDDNFGGGGGAGVKIDPVAFLVIRDRTTRVMPVAVPPVSTVDRIVDMAPDIVDKIGKFFDKKEDGEIV